VSLAAYLIDRIPRKVFEVCPERQWWLERKVTREKLPQYHHLRFNTHTFVNAIVQDIDHEQSALIAYDAENLRPNLLVENSSNGRGHAIYILARPVALATPMMRSYVGDVRKRMAQALPGADPTYNNLWVKNPLHTSWRTHEFHDRLFTLDGLSAIAPSLKQEHAPPDLGEATFEVGRRNADLFNTLRVWAYTDWSAHRKSYDATTWRDIVLAQAEAINVQMELPLPYSEVKATAPRVGSSAQSL
jgi:Replicase family/Primase C terminal 1 (PriCT-1)